MNIGQPPFSRGSSACAGRPASESEPSATSSSSGMGEHPVERLLAGVAGGAEDRDGRHDLRIMHIDGIYAATALVLEDGTVFPGISVGARRRRRGRGLLHDGDDRLRGGRHRPELRRAGALLRLPADRHLRRRRVADGVGARAVRGRRDARRPARVRRAGCARKGVVALSGLDTRTLVRRIRDGGVLRCALGDAPVEELHARALAEPPIDGRPLDRQVGATEPYSVGAGPARRRRRPRLEALDPAPARRRRARGLRRPGLLGRRRDPRGRAAGRPDRERPRRSRPCSTDQVETIRALLGRVPLFGVCLGHQLLGLALGHETFKLPVRPSRRQPPRPRRPRPAACSSPSRTTGSP